MKRQILYIAAGLVLAGCSSTGATQMTLEEGAKEECRSITESGSILPKRICYNKATWAEIDERDREAAKTAIDGVQSMGGQMPKNSGFGS